jgi:hypothetical protein
MRTSHPTKWVFFLLLIPALTGLSCSAPVQTTGTLGATFIGQVKLYDASFARVGQPVTILIPALDRSTVSDDSGQWSMNEIPFGAWDVFATSSGYDTLPYYGTISSGDTTVLGIGSLYPNPNLQLTITSVVWTANSSTIWPLVIQGSMEKVSNDEGEYNIAVFIDSTPDVPLNGAHLIDAIWGDGGDTTWEVYTNIAPLDTFKLHNGMKLYYTACAAGNSGFQGVTGYNETSVEVLNPHTNLGRIISPGPISETYESAYPW